MLIVEDERKLRELVRSCLKRAGFTVVPAGSEAEVITMAAEAAPDLVVLDLGLPDLPGDTVARELRARTPANPPLTRPHSLGMAKGASI